MNTTLKLWTQLGLGTALAGSLLAGCGGEAGGGEAGGAAAGGEAGASGAVAPAGGEGEGEGGAGGEGAGGEGEAGAGGEGEGGVAVGNAASDPVAYGTALAVTQAHVVAARDAYAAGKKEAAAEMFAHPIGEVLAEMDPVFAKLGVADFKPLMTAASAAAADGKSVAEVNKSADAILAALRAASSKAPKSTLNEAEVAANVIADQIERAASMYRSLAKDQGYGAYLDGYGFAKVAASSYAASGPAIKAANPDLHARLGEALGVLAKAYPGVERPAKLAVEPGAVSGASAKVMLAAKG